MNIEVHECGQSYVKGKKLATANKSMGFHDRAMHARKRVHDMLNERS
jgi:hypothetical protein